MSSCYFPLGNLWLTFTKIAFLIYISLQYVFFCYVSETEQPEWHHRQPPSKNQPVSQRQSGFSLSYSSIRHLIFHHLKSHSKWGSSVQRPLCLRPASVIRLLAFLSPHLPLRSPLWYWGTKPSPTTSFTNTPRLHISERQWLLWGWFLAGVTDQLQSTCFACSGVQFGSPPPTFKKKPWVWWRMPIIPELGSGGRGFTGQSV